MSGRADRVERISHWMLLAASSLTIIVNGPIAKKIGMNCGINALGQGNRANATIGRALNLVVRNVGGGRPAGNRGNSQQDQLQVRVAGGDLQRTSGDAHEGGASPPRRQQRAQHGRL